MLTKIKPKLSEMNRMLSIKVDLAPILKLPFIFPRRNINTTYSMYQHDIGGFILKHLKYCKVTIKFRSYGH